MVCRGVSKTALLLHTSGVAATFAAGCAKDAVEVVPSGVVEVAVFSLFSAGAGAACICVRSVAL